MVAFSHAGEFSPGTFELVDWITAQYGKLDALVLTPYDAHEDEGIATHIFHTPIVWNNTYLRWY